MKPETLGELNVAITALSGQLSSHIETSREGHDRLLTKLEELNKTSDLVYQQVLATNHRVTDLERTNKETVVPLVSDYQENRARIRGAITFAAVVSTGAIAGTILLGKLYVDKAKQETADMVYTKIISNLDIHTQ